jgi:hypothetical protein
MGTLFTNGVLNGRSNSWENEVFESNEINTSWYEIASKNNPMPEVVCVYIALKCAVKQIEIQLRAKQ